MIFPIIWSFKAERRKFLAVFYLWTSMFIRISYGFFVFGGGITLEDANMRVQWYTYIHIISIDVVWSWCISYRFQYHTAVIIYI